MWSGQDLKELDLPQLDTPHFQHELRTVLMCQPTCKREKVVRSLEMCFDVLTNGRVMFSSVTMSLIVVVGVFGYQSSQASEVQALDSDAQYFESSTSTTRRFEPFSASVSLSMSVPRSGAVVHKGPTLVHSVNPVMAESTASAYNVQF